MATLVSLGSVNADFHVQVGALPDGPGAVLGERLLRTSGGKAANVAVLAARLGSPALLLGCVGDDDLAEQALAGPRAAGIDVSRVRSRSGATGYSSIVVPPGGAKSIVLVPGANDAWDDEADAVHADVAAVPSGSVLVADLEVPEPVVLAALRSARERGIPTVVDPAPPQRCGDDVLALADHLTPDADEASELTGIDTHSETGALEAGRRLQERGAAVVHMKLPEGGGAVVTREGHAVLHAPADLDVVDATGAGDAFAGALGWALLGGADPVDAARAAVAASACAVTGYGSQESYPALDRLQAMEARVRVAQARGLSDR